MKGIPTSARVYKKIGGGEEERGRPKHRTHNATHIHIHIHIHIKVHIRTPARSSPKL
jgi:hypothetical protein